MKAKTIKAVLAKKHNDFVESIDNITVRELVRQNSIITGGCIASMLLKEKVNDFDYYFTNRDTCLAVANYYVKKFLEANPTFGDIAVNPPKFNILTGDLEDDVNQDRVRIVVKSLGLAVDSSEEKRTQSEDLNIDDLDLVSEQQLAVENLEYRPLYITTNAITLSNKVQLVTRFYGDATDIHSNYDFMHATCYWTSSDGELVMPPKALECLLSRELLYRGSKYPLASIMRAKKFINRGWTINAGQYLKMALQLNELDLMDLDVFEEQLTGVDSAFFNQVITAIRDKQLKEPDFKIDSMYLMQVINRIFD